ncbi:uncharacterized protein LOC108109725 isoform X2 [Drosophila eugracilis]|uniref:uncharacterized protein LOC108109725 isoform X2 n=1 Tax=Drosophila eugracilis TaxID=29029 RepID=UPI001BDA79CE|nr:uncharacterized protein LOC108109725 isoform X2 [Drosophila eugracilis]
MSHNQPDLSEATTLRLINGLAGPGNDALLSVQPQPVALPDVSCAPELIASGSSPAAPMAVGTPTASMAALQISSARQRMLPPVTRRPSQESVHSANENGNSCRICRWNRDDMEIIKCPCNCKGSVMIIAGLHPPEVLKTLDYAQAG